MNNGVLPNKQVSAIATCVALSLATTELCAQDRYRITFGYEYTEGDYGQTQDTEQHSLPFSLSWQRDKWTVQASSYYLNSEGPSSVSVTDSSVTTTDSSDTGVEKDSGFGDTTLSVRRELPWGAEHGLYLDINAAVRLPTASESSGILERDPDYSTRLDAYLVKGRWLPLASIGYKWMGDGDEYDARNIWQASAGAQYQLGNQCSVGGIYDYQQSSSSSGDALKELVGYVACPLNSQWSISTYFLTGFTDSSVNYGGGIQLSWQAN